MGFAGALTRGFVNSRVLSKSRACHVAGHRTIEHARFFFSFFFLFSFFFFGSATAVFLSSFFFAVNYHTRLRVGVNI
jgi:hypothetical protein